MSVVAFRPRPDPPRAARYQLRVTLVKDGRRRLYEIRPLGDTEAQTWVRFDGQPHRALMARTIVAIEQAHAQFLREIAEHERDGWVREP